MYDIVDGLYGSDYLEASNLFPCLYAPFVQLQS